LLIIIIKIARTKFNIKKLTLYHFRDGKAQKPRRGERERRERIVNKKRIDRHTRAPCHLIRKLQSRQFQWNQGIQPLELGGSHTRHHNTMTSFTCYTRCPLLHFSLLFDKEKGWAFVSILNLVPKDSIILNQ